MSVFRTWVRWTSRRGDEEAGQTMAEYGLLLSLISAALLLALGEIGSSIVEFFTSFSAGLTTP